MGGVASAITSRNIFNQELTIGDVEESDESQIRDKCKFNCEWMVSISCGSVLLTFFIYLYVCEGKDLKITMLLIIILCFVITLVVAGTLLARKRNGKPTDTVAHL